MTAIDKFDDYMNNVFAPWAMLMVFSSNIITLFTIISSTVLAYLGS